MTAVVTAALAAVACIGIAWPALAATYTGMTQDLLLRPGPSPFLVLRLICLVLAMALSLVLLARLKWRLDAGRPVGIVGVAVSVAAFGALWVLVWLLAGVPAFGPLLVPVWPAD